MSEASDKVRGVDQLPLFPLPVVLFPGVPLPLHIFEPRYRQLLSDIRLEKNLFGLAYFDTTSAESEVPPPGHVGCVAEVTEVQEFPDGRSNILTLGVIRYRIESYVERGDPYLVAKVSYFEDDEEDEEMLAAPSREVAETFTRIALAGYEERARIHELAKGNGHGGRKIELE